MRKMTFAQATLEAMAEEMKKDDKVYVIGEDIARQGGVFGQFKGLSLIHIYQSAGLAHPIRSPSPPQSQRRFQRQRRPA